MVIKMFSQLSTFNFSSSFWGRAERGLQNLNFVKILAMTRMTGQARMTGGLDA